MLYVIEKKKDKAYLQLYNYFKNDIVKGVYAYGAKLPSKRLVAAETGVSVITVQHAYDILSDEGFIESRERSGFYVIYKDGDFFTTGAGERRQVKPTEAVSNSPKKLENITAMENFPFSLMAKTMRKVLSNYGERLLVKSHSCGCLELRQAIASYLQRSRGLEVETSQIVVGSGAEYLYGLIVQLLGRDKLFALEDPSYEIIRKVYEAHGVRVEMLPMGKEGIETAALQGSKADILHVTPYNSFPSGITATASKRREYVRWVEKGARYIIEDDFASEFTVSMKMEDPLFKLQKQDRVIYMNTFSKTMASSLRIGYMVLPASLAAQFHAEMSFYSCTVPVFEQYVLADFIDSGDFERHINRIRRKLRRK